MSFSEFSVAAFSFTLSSVGFSSSDSTYFVTIEGFLFDLDEPEDLDFSEVLVPSSLLFSIISELSPEPLILSVLWFMTSRGEEHVSSDSSDECAKKS